MKLAAIALAVFVLSVVGVTLATRPSAPARAAVLAQVARDSATVQVRAGADSVRPDSGAGQHADGAAAPGSAGAAAAPQTPDTSVSPVEPAPAAPAHTAPHTVTPDLTALYHRLARIIATMNPQDAAGVLAKMSDSEVVGILAQLGTRPAASLLASLPKDRAALLSERLLSPGKP